MEVQREKKPPKKGKHDCENCLFPPSKDGGEGLGYASTYAHQTTVSSNN